MKKILGKVLIGMLAGIQIMQVSLPVKAEEQIEEPDNLYALSACLMDAESGRILFGKDENEKRANASTTKIMTLIVTLENSSLEEAVTISDYAAGQPDVQLNAKEGEEYLLKDLCYSLMLESHNDSAVAIAEHVGGSVEEFADMMNRKAEEIGCQNTCFLTPNGLDKKDGEKEHGTTASDLARILSYCITSSPKSSEFLEITQTPSYQFSDIHNTRSFSCNNHNAFLTMMDGALTGKTGFTGNAGYCYVGAVKREERTFVVALLGCGWPHNKSYKWADTKKLMQYGIDNYERVELAQLALPKQTRDALPVLGAETDRIGEWMSADVTVVPTSKEVMRSVLVRRDEKIEVVFEKEKGLTAPVKEGQVVGTVQYRLGDKTIRCDRILTQKSIPHADFKWNLRWVCRCFLV